MKQAICHQILGTTFKDIERVMVSVKNERQLSDEQEEHLELAELAPEKFDPEIVFKKNKHASNNTTEVRYGSYSRQEVERLVAATNEPWVPAKTTTFTPKWKTLTREQCEQMVREHLEYKAKETKKQLIKNK